MSELKIGVIGGGGRGGLAVFAHKPKAGSRIVAICDVNEAALQSCRESYGDSIFTTADYHALLEQDLDGVFISTPDFLHEEMAVAALQRGLAVYLEKPMAITTEGCDRVLRAAQEGNARLYVGHNMRHMAFVRKMKELIDAGTIGEIKTAWCRHFVAPGGDYYFRDWHAERKYSNGLLLQKAAHDIDILHWICGSYARRVNALGSLMVYGEAARDDNAEGPRPRPQGVAKTGAWPPLTMTGLNARIDIEDVSLLNMQLDNGVLVSYQQCHFSPDYWRNYTVIGTEGRLENFGNGEDGTRVEVRRTRKDHWGAPDEVHMISSGEGEHGGADPLIVAEFLRFAREGGATDTSPVAARYSVAAGCAATDSLRDGGTPREVPQLAPEVAAYFE